MTPAANETMRLTLFINPTGHHQASWRHPDAQADAGVNLGHYIELVQAAERACFDAIFLADNRCVRAGGPEVVGRVAQYVAWFEPLTLLSALAAVTERIGLISTVSTTYSQPYRVARQLASLDHLSAGRAGWNIVTSAMPPEAANFGQDELMQHDLRYEQAAEYVDVCRGLWDSWEDDAFPRDKAIGQYCIPEKMHTLGHEGQYLKVRGPLNIPRSPQGHPVLVQAGSSPAGTDFAARYADMVFVTPQTLKDAQARYRNTKDLVASHGRDPDHVSMAPGLATIVGRTSEEAEEEYERLQSLLHIDVALSMLSLKLGRTDLSQYPLDEPLPRPSDGGSTGPTFSEPLYALAEREGLTLRQLAIHASGSLAGTSIRGSATEVADVMEEWFRGGAADGFNVQPAYLPGQLNKFIELVVPELQRRGLMRTAYDGRTLRDHFGLLRPAWQPHEQQSPDPAGVV